MPAYSEAFYTSIRADSIRSAREVIPVLLDLVHPRSVVDVGCGEGAWLSVFREHGIHNVRGIDGDWVERRRLLIPQERFLESDLSTPIYLSEGFDLVLSLEVAEHIPPSCAAVFVDSLIRLGDVIVFSAAVPFQEGTHHVNEQWPEYWAQLFAHKGYLVVDCLRKRFWKNSRVGWWYRQNMLLFVKGDRLAAYPGLGEVQGTGQLSLVHPEGYLLKTDLEKRLSGRTALVLLSRVVAKALRARLRQPFRRRRPVAPVTEATRSREQVPD
jgi:SAM-dependent methyltransferase